MNENEVRNYMNKELKNKNNESEGEDD